RPALFIPATVASRGGRGTPFSWFSVWKRPGRIQTPAPRFR
ncbi:hypothetical protein AK812_SmicGene48619, partial [Symbiodinium microadriaticum]